jgi:hypothetical protein
MRETRRHVWLVVGALLGLCAGGCPTQDDDGGGAGQGTDTGRDGSSTGDARLDGGQLAELFGDYEFVSVTRQGSTITTTNQPIGGSQYRADGGLTLGSEGTYSRVLRFYRDDQLVETEEAAGTWSAATPGVVTIDEDGRDPFDANYTYTSGVLTLSRTTGGGPTLDVDALVFRKRS